MLDDPEYGVIQLIDTDDDRQVIAIIANLTREVSVDPDAWEHAFVRVKQKYLATISNPSVNEAIGAAFFAAKDPKMLVRIASESQAAKGIPMREALATLASRNVDPELLRADQTFRSANLSTTTRSLMNCAATVNFQINGFRFNKQAEYLLELLRSTG